MNLTRGGDGSIGRKDSEEVKTKRAQKLVGSKRSKATKQLMSDLKKGKVPAAALLPRSEKQLQHSRYGNLGRKKLPEALKKEMQTKLRNFLQIYGGVLQHSVDGTLIKEWQLLPKHIAKSLCIDDSHLSKCLKSGKKCHGYIWTYKINKK
jgi:hypothetical protein